MHDLARPALRCRPIRDDDLAAVIDLLGRGFPERPARFWRRGFERHLGRALPEGVPRLGYLLEAGGEPAGLLLTLYTRQDFRPEGGLRCNLAAWYVDPAYRPQAALLDRLATRQPEVTYLNVTPAPHTWPIHEAKGFTRCNRGQILCLPLLSRTRPGVTVRVVTAQDPLADLPPGERALVRDHLAFDCHAFVWSESGASGPIVLQRRSTGLGGLVPGVRLPCLSVVYCRSVAEVARVAAPLGRLMARRLRTPLLLLDADGPVPGLVGRFVAGRGIKYGRGPAPVGPGDLAYTETVLFGP